MIMMNTRDDNNDLDGRKMRWFEDEAMKEMWKKGLSLTEKEIEILERECACTCEDWSQFRSNGRNINWNSGWMYGNNFSGRVLLDYSAGMSIKNNEELRNVILKGKDTQVHHNRCLISNTYLENASIVHNSHSITTRSSRGNGGSSMIVTVGAESAGGRPLRITPDCTMVDVCRQLRNPIHTASSSNSSNAETSVGWNVIVGGRVEHNAGCVLNVWVEKGASIVNCSHVQNVVLMEGASASHHCRLVNVYLQWKVEVHTNCVLEEVMVMEATHVGPNSVIMSSILGPDGAYSCGEVHASVLGPHVVSHHQSLLIGVLWPSGRGNVGYGSNVGSNHTGRLANQEAYVEEGTFWGLSCVIIFPVSLYRSYYSLVSAGTQLSSTVVHTRPFSLITSAKSVIPGWVYWYSPYTLLRNQTKYTNRSKATHHASYCTTYTDIFFQRPAILHAVYIAYHQLQPQQSKPTRETKLGITAYQHYLKRFALTTWFRTQQQQQQQQPPPSSSSHKWRQPNREVLSMIGASVNHDSEEVAQWNVLPWEEKNADSFLMALAWKLWQEFGYHNKSTQELCHLLLQCEKLFVDRVIQSYRRDEIRGNKIIPNYASSHVPTEQDPTIQQLNADYQQLQQSIKAHLSTTTSRL